MTPLLKFLKGNPFWEIIQKELPNLGFKDFYPELKTGTVCKVVVRGVKTDGSQATFGYDFPKFAKSFHTALNFRSQLRNFVKAEVMQNWGIFPEADHRVRQPGMFIAHINHDVPKKVLAPPKTMLPEIEVAPIIPEPTEPKIEPKTPVPVSEDMVYVILIANKRDLSTIIEVTDGTAIFKAAKPVPLDKLPQSFRLPPAPSQTLIPPTPEPVSMPVATLPLPETPPAKPERKRHVQFDIYNIMKSDPERVWSAQDFEDIAARATVATSLSIMQGEKRIHRVDRGRYKFGQPKPKYIVAPPPENPTTIRDKLLAKVNSEPEKVFVMTDFLDIAVEKSVMSKLSALVAEKQIERCAKGRYTAVKQMLEAAE